MIRSPTVATRVAFLVAGLSMAAWAPLVPLAKARTGLDEAALGLVLLCFGAGSLIAMPLAGLSSARFGCRRVVLVSVTTLCVVLPLLAIVDRPVELAIVLLAFGAGLGGIDVAMNLQAIAVERALSSGLDVVATVVVLALALALAIGLVARGLSTDVARERHATFAIPRGIVLVVGLLTCAAFLVEGAVLDWSAVFLSSAREVDVSRAGAGYIAFSIAMTIGRFGGDRVVQRIGGRRALVTGASVAALGLAAVALVSSSIVAIAGFALVGFGCANIVPVLFTQAGRQTSMPETLAVPAMTTMGYAGLLAGPALIGFAAQATSLATTFAMLALLSIVVAIAGRRLLR